MKRLEMQQKVQLKKFKKADKKCNEKAVHFEFLLKKFRPDLDPSKLEQLHKEITRTAEGDRNFA